jgi:hypothetical protein
MGAFRADAEQRNRRLDRFPGMEAPFKRRGMSAVEPKADVIIAPIDVSC